MWWAILAEWSATTRTACRRTCCPRPSLPSSATHFTEGYFKGTISIHRGKQEWKFGVESDNIFLHEQFADVITDPSQFDPGTPTTFSFIGNRPDLEQSAFVQDLIRLGNWTISAGVRWDHYQLIVNQNAVSPRAGSFALLCQP